MTVRPASQQDLREIARVHSAAFPGFFLTLMGYPFLVAYYRLVLNYAGGLLYVLEQDGAMQGFVSGFMAPEQFYRYYSKNKRAFLWPMLLAVLRRPRLLPRIIANVLRVEDTAAQPVSTDMAELSSVGVDPKVGGKGLGKALVANFCQGAQAMGAVGVLLTTDADGNEAVNQFYLRQGFEQVRTFTKANRKMNEYRKTLK